MYENHFFVFMLINLFSTNSFSNSKCDKILNKIIKDEGLGKSFNSPTVSKDTIVLSEDKYKKERAYLDRIAEEEDFTEEEYDQLPLESGHIPVARLTEEKIKMLDRRYYKSVATRNILKASNSKEFNRVVKIGDDIVNAFYNNDKLIGVRVNNGENREFFFTVDQKPGECHISKIGLQHHPRNPDPYTFGIQFCEKIKTIDLSSLLQPVKLLRQEVNRLDRIANQSKDELLYDNSEYLSVLDKIYKAKDLVKIKKKQLKEKEKIPIIKLHNFKTPFNTPYVVTPYYDSLKDHKRRLSLCNQYKSLMKRPTIEKKKEGKAKALVC